MLYSHLDKENKVIWIDLEKPTQDEFNQVHSEYGLKVDSPTSFVSNARNLDCGSDILRVTLTHVMPLDKDACAAPLSFILTPNLLVTIRENELPSFENTKKDLKNNTEASSVQIFIKIIENMINTEAQALENLAIEVNTLLKKVFKHYKIQTTHNIARLNKNLRSSLIDLGIFGERLSHIRDIQLGLQRILPFILENGENWIDAHALFKLKKLNGNIENLIQFETHLTNKIQFILDAVLGFINTEQNDIFKVLTIVSVVGIPPTLIASWYGMNFHLMPEYAWIHGYMYVLILAALSVVVPIIWFKLKGWW